ncbi:tonB-dependent Receptor Plug domain protein, partial [Vibrio cholerae HC-51A1]
MVNVQIQSIPRQFICDTRLNVFG